MTIGCHLPSNEVFGRLPGEGELQSGTLPAMGNTPSDGRGFSDPGLFDK